jgi:hypothetical protein
MISEKGIFGKIFKTFFFSKDFLGKFWKYCNLLLGAILFVFKGD